MSAPGSMTEMGETIARRVAQARGAPGASSTSIADSLKL